MNIEKLCPYCLREIHNKDTVNECSYCHKNVRIIEKHPRHLKPLTILAGKYLVGDLIFESGFEITYIGLDLNLKQRVKIKEFYPNGYAVRDSRTATAVIYSERNEEIIKKWHENFVNRAGTSEKSSGSDGNAGIKDSFKENNTVYIITDYAESYNSENMKRNHDRSAGTAINETTTDGIGKYIPLMAVAAVLLITIISMAAVLNNKKADSKKINVSSITKTSSISAEELADAMQETSWKDEYLKLVSEWHEAYTDSYEVDSYELFYLNDDDIPELFLEGEDSDGIHDMIYTVTDGQVKYLTKKDIDGNAVDENRICTQLFEKFNLDKKGLCYFYRFYDYSDYSDFYRPAYYVYKLNGEYLEEIYHAEETYVSGRGGYKYSVAYLRKDGTQFNYDNYADSENMNFEEFNKKYLSELEAEYGFNHEDMERIGVEGTENIDDGEQTEILNAFTKFLNNDISASYHYPTPIDVKLYGEEVVNDWEERDDSLYFHDLGGDFKIDLASTYLYDVDNDGEYELLTRGLAGLSWYILDYRDGNICVLQDEGAMAEKTVLHQKGNTVYIGKMDSGHMGRHLISLVEYNGNGDIAGDVITINAEYWESDAYYLTDKADYTFCGKKITLEEYEQYLNEYRALDSEDFIKFPVNGVPEYGYDEIVEILGGE
ncbi:MAG: hypothetical protein K5894_14170 [Lachnospiraceae bacterium]|nr:hypothetical protein [Lachnospiraceae bacterium]